MSYTATQLAYAAGLIDGEGTVTLTRMSRNQWRSPVVSVSSTTYELVNHLKTTFGGTLVRLAKPKAPHHRQAWHWQVSRDNAIALLAAVEPLMLEPEKKRRARLIVSRYKQVTPRNGRYTLEGALAKQDFEDEFFS